MACRWRLVGLPTPTAASQLSRNSRHCRSKEFLPIIPGTAARQAGVRPLEEHERLKEAPPGSAGVPPAFTPVACPSVSLRWYTRPPNRRERHGLGRSRALTSLPVAPGGLHCVTWSQQRRPIGFCDYSWLDFKRPAPFPGGAGAMGGGPPGSAGVPPAFTPAACPSVSPRWGARPPCRREWHELGRSGVPASQACGTSRGYPGLDFETARVS